MSQPAKKLTYWFVFQNDYLLIQTDKAETALLTENSLYGIEGAFIRQHLLGQFAQFDVYCSELPTDYAPPQGIEPLPFRKALELLGPDWYTIAAKAYAIINWDKNHQFCGRCGALTFHQNGLFERLCSRCGLAFYPRISPSIIVLIQKGDRLLMARGHHFIPGAYGLIAGFVEAGESIENAVHREVKEEVGIHITNLRYFGSQAWPFPDSLMIGFMADYASGELTIDPVEIEAADWYRFDNLPGHPSSSISIAKKLIDYFVNEQTQKHPSQR